MAVIGNITNYVTSQGCSNQGLSVGCPVGGGDGWYSDGVNSYYVQGGYVQSVNYDPCYVAPNVTPEYIAPAPDTAPCLAYGSEILMSDNSTKLIENLEIGDRLMSLSINGLDKNIEQNWETFTTNNLEYSKSTSIVNKLIKGEYSWYYSINNGLLNITYEHPVLIKRNNGILFSEVKNLIEGDYLLNNNDNFILIETIDIINETLNTVSVGIEEDDVYFGNGILVHNQPPPKYD
jgi:hypothetical protein